MKTNIQKVKYGSDKPDKLTWWSWDEKCDECGAKIYSFNDFITSNEPNISEKDMCVDCLRKEFK